MELKINYFIELSYDPLKTLVIWGAGKKGKKTAKLLNNAKIPFIWICNNPNKINKIIYGHKLIAWNNLSNIKNFQSIITIANQDSQWTIKKFFKKWGKKPMKDYFFFC